MMAFCHGQGTSNSGSMGWVGPVPPTHLVATKSDAHPMRPHRWPISRERNGPTSLERFIPASADPCHQDRIVGAARAGQSGAGLGFGRVRQRPVRIAVSRGTGDDCGDGGLVRGQMRCCGRMNPTKWARSSDSGVTRVGSIVQGLSGALARGWRVSTAYGPFALQTRRRLFHVKQ